MLGRLSAIAAAAFLAHGAMASEAPDAETTVEGVVVTAQKAPDQQALSDFVESVGAPTNGRLARWDRKICAGVIGLKGAYAQAMIDRVAVAALAAGLDVGESGCRPNLIIVATDDSDALVKTTVAANPNGFAKYERDLTAGRKAFETFMTSSAPVRWWHVSTRVNADGERYDRGGSVRVRAAGRVNSNTRVDFEHAIVVLDVKRIGKVNFAALADYVAMVGLAQIDPEARVETGESILNLFKDRDAGLAPADALTSWDRAYLSGLYDARRDARQASSQQRDVVRSMEEALSSPSKEP